MSQTKSCWPARLRVSIRKVSLFTILVVISFVETYQTLQTCHLDLHLINLLSTVCTTCGTAFLHSVQVGALITLLKWREFSSEWSISATCWSPWSPLISPGHNMPLPYTNTIVTYVRTLSSVIVWPPKYPAVRCTGA